MDTRHNRESKHSENDRSNLPTLSPLSCYTLESKTTDDILDLSITNSMLPWILNTIKADDKINLAYSSQSCYKLGSKTTKRSTESKLTKPYSYGGQTQSEGVNTSFVASVQVIS